MIPVRVMPCLLLQNRGLVKTVRFRDPKYLGDPVNIIRIFNDKEVDELVLLDISATAEGRGPAFDLIGEIASECFMPLCYGGGIRTLDDMQKLFALGVEKVSLNSAAVADPELVRAAARRFGSQSVIVSLDVQRKLLGGYEVVTEGGRRGTGRAPAEFAKSMEALGAGELLVNTVDRDGTMSGYDLELLRRVTSAVRIPVVAVGGAGGLPDMARAIREGGASAAAAASLFVFHGRHRAVLISYPSAREISEALGE